MGIYTEIVSNFHDVMEDSLTGLPSLTAVSYTYHELESSIDPRTSYVPGSVTNGAYSVLMDKINFVRPDLGLGILDFSYDISLLLCYELNISEAKTSYNAAITDIEEIIKRRLNYNTYQGTDILSIDLVSANPIRWISEPDTEHFGYVEVIFKVTGRTQLN